jgi:hypothetical protein
MKKVIISVGIVAAVALVVCLVPLKEVAYAVMVDYEDTETYYENVPYNATETYTDAVPLSFEANGYIKSDIIEEHQQIIIGDIVVQDEIVEVEIQVACVDVENTDDITGNFIVSFSGFEPMFGEISLSTTLSLSPGEQETADCPADSIINNWDYEVTPSTKEVEAERTVIKYQQVEKQRTIIKQRQETRYKKVTLLDYLLHY